MTLVARTLGLLTLLIITSCSAPIVQNFGGEIYGTTYSIKIAENKSYSFLNTDIIDELNRIDYVFSTYKPTSEISLINKAIAKLILCKLLTNEFVIQAILGYA